MAFMEELGATESHGAVPSSEQNATRAGDGSGAAIEETRAPISPFLDGPPRVLTAVEMRGGGVQLMEGERVVSVEESSPATYLKIIASGELDESLLEALEDYVKRQKKRLTSSKSATANQ
jgi:hypothetical protein